MIRFCRDYLIIMGCIIIGIYALASKDSYTILAIYLMAIITLFVVTTILVMTWIHRRKER